MAASFTTHGTTTISSQTSDNSINPGDPPSGHQLAIIPIAKSAQREVQNFFSELYDTKAVPAYAIALLPIFTESFAGHIFVLLSVVTGWLQSAAFDLRINSTFCGEAIFIPKEYDYGCCDALDFLWSKGLLSPWNAYGGDWVTGLLQGVKEEMESAVSSPAGMMRLEASELTWACWNQYLADCLRGPDMRMENVRWNHRCGRTWRYTEMNGSCDVVVGFTKAKLISDAGKKLEGQKSAKLFRPETCSCYIIRG